MNATKIPGYVRRVGPAHFWYRFWSKVEIGDGCWNWRGAISGGYGMIKVGGVAKKSSRVIWEMFKGTIPDNLFVLHKCDNRACVNIDHLFLGTNVVNMADMVAKRRSRQGEQHPHAKLKETDVAEIRNAIERGTSSPRRLAEMYHVTDEAIYNILHRKTWRWI